MNSTQPVFVHGLSRSGTTLMVTVFDAHPEIAMSYELYPALLDVADPSPRFVKEVAAALASADSIRGYAETFEDRNFRTFLNRIPRGGLDAQAAASLFEQHAAEGMGFRDVRERLRFVERCATSKMRLAGKKTWGLKCNRRFLDYLSIWPDAQIVTIIRDGRDVLASTLNLGMGRTPTQVAEGWARSATAFIKFSQSHPKNVHAVFYEEIATRPAETIEKLCHRMNIPFSPAMLEFHRQDLTIYHTAHTSGPRISQPIDTASVGRWTTDVTTRQLQEFMQTAGPMMKTLGYLKESESL